MISSRAARFLLIAALGLSVSACGRGGGSWPFGGDRANRQASPEQPAERREQRRESSIWDLFGDRDNPNTTVEVNKYIWNAALDVLNFLPVQSVDPFTGVIVTGYGTPPGGGRAYRATVYVQDPALDARSLKLALETRGGGAVSPDTARAVEDAILTRARQLRIADSRR